ncbi:hypothetical protein CPB83DRAFT_891703 [Crepidotus variabilis]|uniref:F-box domain-containing protein n=1 Tax=Crepidotus variabilis TaxID=179855 RepID=A0A9P6ELH4_9AGAR|nr:hypothetical protein CPB83DRAFT_891703 [Crepidotus variabilis]
MSIKNISSDILYSIFALNTPSHPSTLAFVDDYTQPRAWPGTNWLGVATRTSQVCQEWRQVLLSSPSVWSKIIDLNALGRCKDPSSWLGLITDRAAGLPLSVYGDIERPEVLQLFLGVVDKSWSIIKILRVYIHIKSRKSYDFPSHAAWRKITEEVSPELEYCDIDVAQGSQQVFPTNQCLLINTNNSNLKTLLALGGLQFIHILNAPIFKNLRQLVIENTRHYSFDNQSFPWSLDQLFSLLRDTPLLERLSLIASGVILNPDDLQQPSAIPIIRLPRLQDIRLVSSVGFALGTAAKYCPKQEMRYKPQFHPQTRRRQRQRSRVTSNSVAPRDFLRRLREERRLPFPRPS